MYNKRKSSPGQRRLREASFFFTHSFVVLNERLWVRFWCAVQQRLCAPKKYIENPGLGRAKKKRTDARNGSVLPRLNTTGLLCSGVLLSMNTNWIIPLLEKSVSRGTYDTSGCGIKIISCVLSVCQCLKFMVQCRREYREGGVSVWRCMETSAKVKTTVIPSAWVQR